MDRAQSLVFSREGGRDGSAPVDPFARLGELAAEQGVLAGLTPLRDVAGLADNLPLLIVAAIVVFRASIEPQRSGGAGAGRLGPGPAARAGPRWSGGSARCTSSTGSWRGRRATWSCPSGIAWSSRRS